MSKIANTWSPYDIEPAPDDWILCNNCKHWGYRYEVEGAECCIQKAKDEAEAAYEEECYGPGA